MCRSFIITFHFYPPNGCLKLKCNVELWVRVTILLPHLKRNLINHDLLSHPITVIYSSTFIREIHHVLPCNHLFSIVFKKIICLQYIHICIYKTKHCSSLRFQQSNIGIFQCWVIKEISQDDKIHLIGCTNWVCQCNKDVKP